MNRIVYVDDRFVAFGGKGYIATSIDGLTWTEPVQLVNAESGNIVSRDISAMIKIQ